MNTTKTEFLKNISQALGRETIPSEVKPFDFSQGPQHHMLNDLTQEEIVAKFKNECALVGTKLVEATEENLAEILKQVILQANGSTVLCPDVPEVETYGIRNMLETTTGLTYQKWDAKLGHEALINMAKDSSIGITFPTMAIANTATIVQPSYINSGRAIGLLPLTHIAIVKKSTILPRMTQSMAKLTKEFQDNPDDFPRNIVLISGPSNTADIELIRVVGVHGPINVTFILLDN